MCWARCASWVLSHHHNCCMHDHACCTCNYSKPPAFQSFHSAFDQSTQSPDKEDMLWQRFTLNSCNLEFHQIKSVLCTQNKSLTKAQWGLLLCNGQHMQETKLLSSTSFDLWTSFLLWLALHHGHDGRCISATYGAPSMHGHAGVRTCCSYMLWLDLLVSLSLCQLLLLFGWHIT